MANLDPNVFNMAAIGAGIAVGFAGIGTGLSQGPIGAATVGAVAEDRSFFGLGIVFVALPETIVIFGLVVSILLMFAI